MVCAYFGVMDAPFDQLDIIFRAVADPTRRAMIQRLTSGDHSVTELAEPFDISLAAVSKHIKVLESAGIVIRTMRGRRNVCRLNPEPLSEARRWFDHYEKFWTSRLDALEQALLEEKRAPESRSTTNPEG